MVLLVTMTLNMEVIKDIITDLDKHVAHTPCIRCMSNSTYLTLAMEDAIKSGNLTIGVADD